MSTRNEQWTGLREFLIAGVTFELLETVNPVDITFYGADDDVLCVEKQVVRGHWVDRREKKPYSRFEITTSGLEVVKFTASDGMSGSRSAPTAITSNVQPLGLTHVPLPKTAGAASSQMLAALATRRYLFIQNQSTSENVYIRTDGAAATVAAQSLKLPPGAVYEPMVPPLGVVTMIRGGAVDADLHVIEA